MNYVVATFVITAGAVWWVLAGLLGRKVVRAVRQSRCDCPAGLADGGPESSEPGPAPAPSASDAWDFWENDFRDGGSGAVA